MARNVKTEISISISLLEKAIGILKEYPDDPDELRDAREQLVTAIGWIESAKWQLIGTPGE